MRYHVRDMYEHLSFGTLVTPTLLAGAVGCRGGVDSGGARCTRRRPADLPACPLATNVPGPAPIRFSLPFPTSQEVISGFISQQQAILTSMR